MTGPFDDLGRAMFARCFVYQAADGGLPETFPGTTSGSWTSAEIYAAIATFGFEALCPPGAIDALETWLLRVCASQGGLGLAHYPAGPDAHCIVEASASLAIGLAARHPGHPAIATIRRWLVDGQAKSGGWGISPGEPERAYSTGYALMALDPVTDTDACQRGRAWLEHQRLPDGTWSFRPGVAARAWTPTQIAASALGLRPGEVASEPVRRHLVAGAEAPSVIEEDEMPTRGGWKLTFTYAPRLVCIGGALMLAEARPDDPWLRRTLRALARHQYQIQRAGRPAVDATDDRLWHYIEFAWGYGMVCTALSRLGEAIQARYADEVAVLSTELGRQEGNGARTSARCAARDAALDRGRDSVRQAADAHVTHRNPVSPGPSTSRRSPPRVGGPPPRRACFDCL